MSLTLLAYTLLDRMIESAKGEDEDALIWARVLVWRELSEEDREVVRARPVVDSSGGLTSEGVRQLLENSGMGPDEDEDTGFGFDDALRALKAGRRVSRAGWNGKGMWLVFVQGRDDVDARHGVERLLPWIGMRTADGGFVPWLASQTDMLAEDWEVVP